MSPPGCAARAQRVKGRRPAAGRHGAGAGGVRRQCAYFNTHSYTPFQLVDYLDDNINVGRGVGTISLDEGRTYLRFLDIDQPIYNLRFDGLVSDDTEPLHADSTVIFTIEAPTPPTPS